MFRAQPHNFVSVLFECEHVLLKSAPSVRAFYKTLVVSHMSRATSPLVPSPQAVDGRSGVQRPYSRAPRAAIDAATQAFAAPAFQHLAVHFAPVLAENAALAPVIEYMAPALVLADRHGSKVPFVQGEQVLQAQSFENIVGSSEFWSAQDSETWDLFLFFRVTFAETVFSVEMGSPLHADLVSPMLVATSVGDIPLVPHLVVCVQHVP